MPRRVFISHTQLTANHPADDTFLDAAIRGAQDAGWECQEMAAFPATPRTPPQECEKQLRDCEAVVGILGFDWGSEVPGHPGVSYCKYELELGQSLRPQSTFYFIIDGRTTAFPADVLQSIPDADREKQRTLRLGVKLHAKRVISPDELQHQISRSLRLLDSPPEKIEDLEKIFMDYVEAKDYDQAWRFFAENLNFRLDFQENQHHRHLTLLLRLFPLGVEKEPAITSPSEHAAVLNALARAYKNTGLPGRAAGVFKRALALPQSDYRKVICLANYLNALRLIGCYTEAEEKAKEMEAIASNLVDNMWEAYSLYWNGVLMAGFGCTDEAVRSLRQSQVRFLRLSDQKAQSAGLGRIYAHLAQLELWLDNPMVALCYAQHAYRFTERHEEPRERIFTYRLLGTANMLLGRHAIAKCQLSQALEAAHQSHYLEEEIAANIALAELESRTYPRGRAGSRLSDASLRHQISEGRYAMLMVDFNIAHARQLMGENRMNRARELAKEAVKLSSDTQSTRVYRWGLVRAARLLGELGDNNPMRVLLDSRQNLSPVRARTWINQREALQADIRSEYTRLFRHITGHYRYAPAKFVGVLRDDLNKVRAILENQAVDVSPQRFLEIHLTHACNLNCVYCRGALRPVPTGDTTLPTRRAINLIKSVYEMNPQTYVRFSGLVGEPLMHPDIIDILKQVASIPGGRWGLTTNGIRMSGNALLEIVSRATHVHISLDAGTSSTYRKLKKAQRGDFEKVLENIAELSSRIKDKGKGPEVVVSYLLQGESFQELPSLAKQLREMRVRTLEIKMQHFHSERHMTEQTLRSAYRVVERVQYEQPDEHFHVIAVQSEDEALKKIRENKRTDFSSCYASLLGLSPTIDPSGNVQSCCQYYQRTLGSVGNVSRRPWKQVWLGASRRKTLDQSPSGICDCCSPSDEFINRFVSFLKHGYEQDDSFLDWVQAEVEPLFGGRVSD